MKVAKDDTQPRLSENITDALETRLLKMLVNGVYAPGTALPAEREFAAQLGVTRPTLREVISRLERDGWLTVQQGKATVVNDVYRDGGLNALSAIVQHSENLPPEFVSHLLRIRQDLAPSYTRMAVERAPKQVIALLDACAQLEDSAEAYAHYDWTLHHQLTLIAGNPIYTMILNGFAGFYERMARVYFSDANARKISRNFYGVLLSAARNGDTLTAEAITRSVMRESVMVWEQVSASRQ